MQITGNRFNHFVQFSKFIFNVTCSINELGSDLDPDLDSCNYFLIWIQQNEADPLDPHPNPDYPE